jgi:hypothetical protein
MATSMPDRCFDAQHAELMVSTKGDPFLVLVTEEGVDCAILHLTPFLEMAAAIPQLREIMEKSLAHT